MIKSKKHYITTLLHYKMSKHVMKMGGKRVEGLGWAFCFAYKVYIIFINKYYIYNLLYI